MSDLPFSPNEVLNLLGLPQSEKSSIYLDCPNCGKKRKLNIVLFGSKAHMCRCNACNWKGNSISLYGKITGTEEPYKDIVERLGGNTKPATSYREEKHLTSSIASVVARTSCFVNMFKELTLEEEDLKNLQKRGLPKEVVQRKAYRSIYLPTYEDARSLAKKLERKGVLLKGVQGFYKNKNQWSSVRVKHKGFTVPYVDRHALVQGFQIRKRDFTVLFLDYKGNLYKKEFVYKHDDVKLPEPPFRSNYDFVSWSSDLKDITENKIVYPIYKCKADGKLLKEKVKVAESVLKEMENTDDNRYYWFSSRDYEEGVGSPCFVHYATEFALNVQAKKYNAILSETLFITEGALKADIFHYFTKLPCLAISGVNCQEELMKELEAYKKVVKKVVVAFDMDYLTNPYVVNAEAELKEKIQKLGYEYFRLTWDEKYKGIDDYCQSNNGRFDIKYTADKSVLTCVSRE
ncbi:MAG: DUF3854 domain-containing protein [Lachnospiraceae bacterium]|nr:DUF3854 domain-containing protein [Lachnospiraceae bacterium]